MLQVCEEPPLSFIPPVHQTSTNTSCAYGQVRQTATVEDTRKQHELLLLALKLKHGLTDEALEDTLKVVNVISQRHAVSSTKHHFYKTFDDLKRNIQFHYICEGCTISVNIEGEKVVCPNCQYSCRIADHMKQGHFFIVFPLESQLRNMMEQEELFSQLTRPNSAAHSSPLTDITDGELYKRVNRNIEGQSEHHVNLTLTFSCDGVPVFKKSSYSIWPLLYTVNELPPDLRAKQVMLAALWFGPSKPNCNTYLSPFVKECNQLLTHGFEWISVNGIHGRSKVFPLVAVCDSVARPMIQNFKQFNGEFGCSYCLQKGTVVEKGQGHVRVYPFESDTESRNHGSSLDFAREAIENRTTVKGVKGPSILSLIPSVDLIQGCVPDYMHACLLGVARSMTYMWVGSDNHENPWYVGRCIQVIDQKLHLIQPPSCVSRVPRSLRERNYWKAHEWYMWLFYYSIPVLKGILPECYLIHWTRFVKALALLLTESVTLQQIQEADIMLRRFVMEMGDLYGIQNMSYNVHLSLHLAQSVRNWGPLWAHSAFTFESYNHSLLKMIKSTQGVPLQIAKTFQLQKGLPLYAKKTLSNASSECISAFEDLVSPTHTQSAIRCKEVIALGGRHEKVRLEQDDYLALHNVANHIERELLVSYRDRAVINGEVTHSKRHSRERKRNSHVVVLTDNSIFSVDKFVVADLVSGEHCYAIGHYFETKRHSFFASLSNPHHFVAVGKKLGHLTAVPAAVIQRKCLFMNLPNLKVNYVFMFLNRNELTN